MNLLWDIYFIIKSSLLAFVEGEATKLLISIGIGTVLAALGWLVSINYHRLWNRGFKIRRWHHVLCALVAFKTFLFTLIFASFMHIRAITEAVIVQWNKSLIESTAFFDGVSVKTYDEIKKLGVEDFSGYLPPSEGGKSIPTNTKEAKELAAKIYAEAVAKNFEEMHPFLSKIIWSSPEEATKSITEQTIKFFEENPGMSYDVENSVKTATEKIRAGLEEQIDDTVLLSRIAIVVVFLLLQLIPFGIISYQAYSELKIRN